MKILAKIKDKLQHTNYFDLSSIKYTQDGNVYVRLYPNCLIAEPRTLESARQIRSNPYTRLLKTHRELFALYRFPLAIHDKAVREENIKSEAFKPKYRTRLANLQKSQKEENIHLYTSVSFPAKLWLDFEYVAKDFKKDTDFQDDEIDTTCRDLAKPQKPYQEIKKVSLNNKTLLILKNAKVNKNHSLDYYLQKGSNAFYNDIILNYILLHSELLEPDYFTYDKASKVVHIPAKELFKLYPHSTFKLETESGVSIKNISRPNAKRISKNDLLSFEFSDSFLDRYKAIILKSADNVTSPESFIKVPVFFLLQAMKEENLTHNSFRFVLWVTCMYRMKSAKIYHSIRTIIADLGMDTKHGYSKPLKILNRYFEYLFKVNAIYNIPEHQPFTKNDLDNPPTYKATVMNESGEKETMNVLYQLRVPKLKLNDKI